MATITTLSVTNIRSHHELSFTLSPHVTIITGPNGSGKTSLLEAIHITLQGTSFKGTDQEVLAHNTPWWRIGATLDSEQTRIVKYNPTHTTKRKQCVIDDVTTIRLPAKHKYPIVLFEPDDLRLLHGSPSRRRQFIDRFISQLNPSYGPTLRKYERALKQRNSLLKRPHPDDNQLFAWNIALAEHGAYVIEQRIAFIEQLNQHLGDFYRDIAGTHDEVSIHYSHTFVGDIKQKLLHELHAHLDRDYHLGNTSVGPHRHDLIFELNQSPALSTASRGEARTIVLALKFLEVDIIKQLVDTTPIILLDDVFSELDASRQHLLTEQLSGCQIIITSATESVGEGVYRVDLSAPSKS